MKESSSERKFKKGQVALILLHAENIFVSNILSDLMHIFPLLNKYRVSVNGIIAQGLGLGCLGLL